MVDVCGFTVLWERHIRNIKTFSWSISMETTSTSGDTEPKTSHADVIDAFESNVFDSLIFDKKPNWINQWLTDWMKLRTLFTLSCTASLIIYVCLSSSHVHVFAGQRATVKKSPAALFISKRSLTFPCCCWLDVWSSAAQSSCSTRGFASPLAYMSDLTDIEYEMYCTDGQLNGNDQRAAEMRLFPPRWWPWTLTESSGGDSAAACRGWRYELIHVLSRFLSVHTHGLRLGGAFSR